MSGQDKSAVWIAGSGDFLAEHRKAIYRIWNTETSRSAQRARPVQSMSVRSILADIGPNLPLLDMSRCCGRVPGCGHSLRRKAGARSVDAIAYAIGALLDSFTSQECANYLANSGYAQYQSHHALVTSAWRSPARNELARAQIEPLMAALPTRLTDPPPRPGWVGRMTAEGLVEAAPGWAREGPVTPLSPALARFARG